MRAVDIHIPFAALGVVEAHRHKCDSFGRVRGIDPGGDCPAAKHGGLTAGHALVGIELKRAAEFSGNEVGSGDGSVVNGLCAAFVCYRGTGGGFVHRMRDHNLGCGSVPEESAGAVFVDSSAGGFVYSQCANGLVSGGGVDVVFFFGAVLVRLPEFFGVVRIIDEIHAFEDKVDDVAVDGHYHIIDVGGIAH